MSPPDPWLLCDPYCAQFKCYHEEEIEMNEEPPVTEAELARAIEHAEKVASEAQGRCSQEHAQLAEWLRELAAARAAIKAAREALNHAFWVAEHCAENAPDIDTAQEWQARAGKFSAALAQIDEALSPQQSKTT